MEGIRRERLQMIGQEHEGDVQQVLSSLLEWEYGEY